MGEENTLLTVAEAAKLLRSTSNTVRVWLCKEKVIPKCLIIKLGRKVLFNELLLKKWISLGCPLKFDVTDRI